MRISLKNSTPTEKVSKRHYSRFQMGDTLLMPCSVPLAILPSMISPLNGRNTIMRNLTVKSQRHC